MRRSARLILTLSFTLVSASAGVLVSAPSTARASGLLICDGDSQTLRRPPLTAGQPWCEILSARKGQVWPNIWNYATSDATSGPWSGNVTNNVISRLQLHLLAGSENCLGLMIGINDAWRDPNLVGVSPRLTPAQTKANYLTILKFEKAHGNEVTIFLNSPFWSTYSLQDYPAYIRAIREAAEAESVPVVDSYTLDDLDDCWLYPAGTPEYGRCVASYIPNEPPYHVNSAVNLKIANLCNKPENANACACRPN